jgi:hypothetical protein
MPAPWRTSPGEAMTRFVHFMMADFPRLNCACRDGELSLNDWIAAVAPVARELAPIVGHVTPQDAELLIRGGGMIVLAGERLAQPRGLVPGEILFQLPGLTDMLILLYDRDGRPALTHKGYWLDNLPPRQITFTDSSHERFFIAAVQAQTAMRQTVNNLLMLICTRAVGINISIASRVVQGAADVMEQAQLQYRDFHHGPGGEPGQTPTEFNEMRVWLTKTRIGGVTYGGPNAAYIPEMAATDFVIGTADNHYAEYVAGFLGELDAEERGLLESYINQPSLIEVISHYLGFAGASTMSLAPMNEVAGRLAESPNLLATATAARNLYKAFCGGSGAHVGLINTHLTKYGASLTPEERAALPVDPGKGVGGHGHDHTRSLHDTRRTNPAWKNLTGAISRINASPGAGREGAAA